MANVADTFQPPTPPSSPPAPTPLPHPPIYLGLVHGPVVNRHGEQVTTSVTNMDIHDIARTCRTFGFSRYLIITPLQVQHELLGRILGHWQEEASALYHPKRFEALSLISVMESIAACQQHIQETTGQWPLTVVTGARFERFHGDSQQLCQHWGLDKRPMLLLFGTGWGLAPEVVEAADFLLTPIYGAATDQYNHLSVRSAVAIYCDRLQVSLRQWETLHGRGLSQDL